MTFLFLTINRQVRVFTRKQSEPNMIIFKKVIIGKHFLDFVSNNDSEKQFLLS